MLCAKNAIVVSVTKCPIALDYDGLSRMFRNVGVEFQFFLIAVEKTS